jgi:hypothetical protein
MDAAHKEMMAEIRAWRKEMKVGQETTEAHLECKEPTSEKESIAEHQEAPMEEAVVKPVGGLKKWHRGRNLAAECHGQPEERSQGNCGSRKKLAAACRGTTPCAGVAWRKGNSGKNRTTDNVERGAPKGREETVEGPGIQDWNKGRRHQTAAVS